MNTRYVIGIFITVSILSANQVFIQYWLAQKKYDANTINIAGKQRMLSQRINTEFYRVQNDNATPDLLHQLFQQWKSAHYELQTVGNEDKSVLTTNAGILLALKPLDTNIEFIESQLHHIGSDKINLTLITQNQSSFLPKMDKVVKTLEKEADEKLQFIINMEYFLFFIALLILTLEVIFIYVPIERSLKKANHDVSKKNVELEKAVNSIKRKNKELEQITYITSHDLQEPVRTINSLVNMFNKKYKTVLDTQGIKMLDYLDVATLRMRDLIKDLLEYSVIGKKREKTKIDCHDLLETITDDLSLKINNTNATINWNKMPQIMGIKAEMRLLFQNLISNALKFQSKSNSPEINIDVVEKEDYWQFSVSDNGIGIEPAHLDKIFSIFHRVHSKDKFEGTGIGLAHCAKIVDIHGGEIWVESTLNEGSTFFFTIKKIEQNNVEHEKEIELHLTH